MNFEDFVRKLNQKIQTAKNQLEQNPVEDDGLTCLSVAATPESMCYVDKETALIMLNWFEQLISS
jgi:hypothetical protein